MSGVQFGLNTCSILQHVTKYTGEMQLTTENYSHSITLGLANNIGFLRNALRQSQRKRESINQRGYKPGNWSSCRCFHSEWHSGRCPRRSRRLFRFLLCYGRRCHVHRRWVDIRRNRRSKRASHSGSCAPIGWAGRTLN